MELKEYYKDLMKYLGSADGDASTEFLEYVGMLLDGLGILDDLSITNFRDAMSAKRQMAASAWSLHSGSGTLHLFLVHFRAVPSPENIGKQDFQRHFSHLENFVEAALSDRYADLFPSGSPQGDLADQLQRLWGPNAENEKAAREIRFHLVTNCRLSTHEEALEGCTIAGVPVTFEIWDIQRLFKIEESGRAREDIRIDLMSSGNGGLPALAASHPDGSPNAFLFAMPGSLLADIYGRYGDRLLEQNVRTFLQFRGKVNRGLRNTVQHEPHLFFAYNNGLTTTADAVDFDAHSGRIKSVTNLQIVNGGQTTAAIFASTMLKVDVSKVFVQVKLSVVEPEQADELVPKISEYANTQNKVSVADLSSNHPFQRRMEELSRRLTTRVPGALEGTRWFYERTRGQYMNAQLKMTPGQRRKFAAENPRNQVITKTDLAKYEFAFSGKPHIVSLGAQKCFVRFAEHVAARWDKEEINFNDLYFRQAIGRAIIFRQLDKRILKQPWYDGYKANIVAYTLAIFSLCIETTGKVFDYQRIWSQNTAPEELMDFLSVIAADVNHLIKQGQDVTSNISEYCKREVCWDRIKPQFKQYSPPPALLPYIVDERKLASVKAEAAATQEVANSVAPVVDVLHRGAEYWQHFEAWSHENPCLSPFEARALHAAACDQPLQNKQATALLKGLKRAIDRGYFPLS